jgi:HEAT repeat protein
MRLGKRHLRQLLFPATALALTVSVAAQSRGVKDRIAELESDDPAIRARAACELKADADLAADGLAPLIRLLGDGAPVERVVCKQRWWRNSDLLTTPGQEAAGTLVAMGTRAYEPLVAALQHPQWIARRNAAWALGALDDPRAVKILLNALKDREAGVRAQAAWALGALDDRIAMEPLTAALKDEDVRVRAQAAWALGAIGDSGATAGLIVALKDTDPSVRRQAAWALGAIGK